MLKRTVSGIFLMLLLTSMLSSAFNIQPVKASGTIYIRADGSVDPPTASISSVDNVTYTFTDNIHDSIVVERSNIIIDGNGYDLQGGGSGNGFSLSNVENVTIKNVNIEDFDCGAYLHLAFHSILSGNNISNNAYGIELYSSCENDLSGNNVINNRFYGIELYSSLNNTLSKNNITNSNCGVYFSSSSNNIFSGNNVINNTYGVVLESSSNNNLSANDIINNGHGIRLYSSSNKNTLSGNNITKSGCGIKFYASSKNLIYHNKFGDNSYQVLFYSSGYANFWDDGYPSGGNYWSDYNGTDLFSGPFKNETGCDGIGDTPYIIDANNTDNYPLMQPYRGPVRNLNTGQSYPTIQGAINNASEGDAIFVLSGTYYEHVVVNKTVSLIGENRRTTIIDGGGVDTVVTIIASKTNIRSFTIQNGGPIGTRPGDSGILCLSDNNNVTNNNVMNNGCYGIYVSGGSNNIAGNNITGNRYGIRLYSSGGNNIANNNITYNTDWGLRLDYSYSNNITNNTVTNNGYLTMGGIGLYFSPNNKVIGNKATNNNGWGIHLYESSGSTLRDNIMNSNRWNFGFWTYYISNARNQDIDTSNRVNGKAVYYMINRKNITIEPSTYPEIGYLALIDSTNIVVKDLFFASNGEGVLFMNVKNSTLKNVNITGNYIGIVLLLQSSGNIILSNTVSETYYYGMYVYSGGNIFYSNNFIGMGWGGIWIYGNNTWDNGYPSGGNYWSDYTGVDLYNGPYQNVTGSDGIGDTPYVIDENNVDRYPFMSESGWEIPTPEQAIQDLIDIVESMNLQQGIDNSLDAKLANVLASLEAFNADQRNDTINKLCAFINQVEGQRGNKIKDEQADFLIAKAQQIIDLIKG